MLSVKRRLQGSQVTARAFSRMPPFVAGTPTFLWGSWQKGTLWNRREACSARLVCIALQPVVERLRELNLELHMWYLDDGLLVGNVAAIKAALAILKELLPWRGLELNPSKCKLFGPGATSPDVAFDGIPRHSLDEGTVVLGVPIGNDAFVNTIVDDDCAKLTHMAERIGLLKSNIANFLLLRACFGACRINHLLRSLPFQHARLLAEKSSVFVRNALDEILGSPLPDICFLLACLPVRKGGLGIHDPALVLNALEQRSMK